MSFINAGRDTFKFWSRYVKGKPEELLQAVLAAARFNNLITPEDFKYTDGKKRSGMVNYYPLVCSDTGTGSENICDAGTTQALQQERFTLSQITASNVYQLNKDDVRYVDNTWSFKEHALQQIAAVLPTVRRKMSTQMSDLMVANVGILPNGNATRVLPMVEKDSGSVNPIGVWEIERAYTDSGYSNPFIIGGTDVFYWKKAVAIGGVNDNGLNVAQMGRTNAYYDNLINTSFNDTNNEHVLSFDPMMIKFIAYNENAGIFATDKMDIDSFDSLYTSGDGGGSMNGVFVDPMTGLVWDLDVNYDKCNKRWTWQIKLNWDIFIMPPSVCNIQGVNGIFHWKTCLPQNVTCEGDSPISPTASATYAYETSGNITFPLYIANLNIGGQKSTPEIEVANIAALAVQFNDNFNGVTFTVSGTELRYTGYAEIDFIINDGLTGEVDGTFTTS